MGNLVKAGSFGRVWEGAAFRALRQAQVSDQRPALCHQCDDFLVENRFLHRMSVGDEVSSTR